MIASYFVVHTKSNNNNNNNKVRDTASLPVSIAIKLEWECKLGSITCRQWWRKVTTSGGANLLT